MTGNILKEKLQLLDIQLSEIARKLNISPQSLQSRLKTKDVTISFLIELAEAVNKSPYFFIKNTLYEKYFESSNEMDIETPNKDLMALINAKDKIIELLENDVKRMTVEINQLKGHSAEESKTA
ncbi:helix-turn-helix domain-containing protein [Flavobacterium sp. UBA4197]|uniref:helix-turn-helix domain-containing protein n=1 Tax=Flavobacterium sp. UBA4197 TaxID=1946546 RepID=UPI00257AB96F|nr:helix-turn-helix transcriptional regulator [Flavobacterium sp. UBA4197]